MPRNNTPNIKPLIISLDGIASFIAGLLLWLLPMNPYSYAAGSFVLAVLVMVFVWLLPIPLKGIKLTRAKIAICVAALAVLAAVIIPEGFDRFGQEPVIPAQAASPNGPNALITVESGSKAKLNLEGNDVDLSGNTSLTSTPPSVPVTAKANKIKKNGTGTVFDVRPH